MRRLLTLPLIAAALLFAGCYSTQDVQDACAAHGGIQATEDVTWDFSHTDGDALLVICKNGTVHGLG